MQFFAFDRSSLHISSDFKSKVLNAIQIARKRIIKNLTGLSLSGGSSPIAQLR